MRAAYGRSDRNHRACSSDRTDREYLRWEWSLSFGLTTKYASNPVKRTEAVVRSDGRSDTFDLHHGEPGQERERERERERENREKREKREKRTADSNKA
jgi:hypothetical protein